MTTNKDFPEVDQTEETIPEAIGHVLGTLTVDKDGIFRMYYIGPHNVLGKKYFGNGVVALRNIRELFNIVGSRINNAKPIYIEKILEIENAKLTDEPKDTDSI